MSRLNSNKIYWRAIKIAVVDDHYLFRAGLIALLKDFSRINVVVQAVNGKELLKQLKTISEKGRSAQMPDVVLLDIQMPEMNGMETTLKLQEDYPGIKIIILTMHNEEEFIFDLMNKGASGFIAKDKSTEMLLDSIYSVMEKGIYFNEQILKAIVKGARGILKQAELAEVRNFGLTEREIRIIQLVCDQKTNREIAMMLELSQRTVESHRTVISSKTETRNAAGLVMFAIKNNLITIMR